MRWRAFAALAAVITSAWLLGTFRVQTFHQAGAHTYDFDFQGASWIEAAEAAPRTYFRLDFTLTATPDNAVIWVDAQQRFTAFVDGRSVGTNAGAVKSGLPPRAVPVDVTRHLAPGSNAVAIEVTDADGGAAAVRARISIQTGGNRAVYSTGAPTWRATSDLTQVKPRASLRKPHFSAIAFDDSAWPQARQVAPIRTGVQAAVPADVVEQSLDAAVIGPPKPGPEMVASVAVTLPGDPQDGWFRVAASGPYSIFADGDLLTAQASVVVPSAVGQGAGLTRLSLYNFGPYLHRGVNVLAVHVAADPLAALYLDGSVQTTGGTVAVATDSHWGVSAPPFGDAVRQPPTSAGIILGNTKLAFPHGVVERIAGVTKVNIPGSLALSNRLLTLGGLLILWVITGGAMALAGGLPFVRALVLDGAAHVPAIAATVAAEQLTRMHDVIAPFPHIPAVLGALVLFLLASKLAVALVATGALARLGAWARARLARRPSHDLRGRLAPVVAAVRHRWNVAAIALVALVSGGVTAYRLDYEPYWQDELASLAAARGVRAHIVPQLPSTFVYWKGELYSGAIGLLGAITHDNVASLRFLSIFWYVATVVAFGVLLVPMLIPRRPFVQLLLTVLFATAPVELEWARDVRMYQQAQFFAVIFVVLFFHAMRRPRLLTIAGSAAALILMYLSHEETFIFLPVIPVVAFGMMRLRWVRNWRWWLFGGAALVLIGGQYVLTQASHPPFFGFDHSNKPYIGFDTHNFWFYLTKVYFPVTSRSASLGLLSTLAVIAGIMGVYRRSVERLYLSAFLWIPIVALSTVFTPKVPRYVFVTMPILFVLAGAGALDVLGFIRTIVTFAGDAVRSVKVGRLVVRMVAVPAVLWLALSLTGGLRDYGLAVSRLTGATMSHKHVDYDYVARYVAAHQSPGDLLLTLAPPNVATFYIGRAPDMTIATGRDKLLYIMERGGRAVDTTFGAPVILTRDDLQHVLDAHHRIWLVTDQGPYLNSVDTSITSLILADFDLVSEGETSALYFRGD